MTGSSYLRLAVALLWPGGCFASTEVPRVSGLEPETVRAFDQYVRLTESVLDARLHGDQDFLWPRTGEMREQQRRMLPPKALPDELVFDDVTVDFRSYEAHKGGKTLDLTRKEFHVLRLLASRAGEVVTRDELLNEVWGYENYPTTRTVDNHVAALRAKLERDPADPQYLRTVHGVGYKFVPKGTSRPDQAADAVRN